MKVNWIEGRGYDSNVYLLQNDISILIDAGTGLRSDAVKRKIENFGIKPQDIDILINTHSHFDHTGGDLDFHELSNCKILASEPAAKALRNADEEKILAGMIKGDLEPLPISQTLDEDDEIKLGDSKLNIISTPGHTQGCISLYEPEEKILFSGDSVFKGGVGRMDLPSSNRKAMKESLQKLAELDVEKLYPGHGPVAEENAQRYIQMGLNFLG